LTGKLRHYPNIEGVHRMKRVLAGLAGAIVLAGMSSMGIAQAPEKTEQPAAKREAQQPKASPAPRATRQADRPAAHAPVKRPAAAQRSRPQPPAAGQAAERKRAQQGPGVDRKSGQPRRQAQDKRAQEKVLQRQARRAAKTVGPKQVEKGQRRPDVTAKGEPRATPPARMYATDQQRREVHRGLFRQGKVERIARNRLGISLAVGNHVPRRHRLHRFTPALIALAPLYAAYSYIVVDDTICVVDSSTYAIVDMIESSIEAADPLPVPALSLNLSPEQMRLIYASVPKDRARTELRIRLAIGAEIPRSVELYVFPTALIAQVPQVASFRYIVVQDDVVIVDPAAYEIAMVIS
jgi:uncharacterized protein DUF1236